MKRLVVFYVFVLLFFLLALMALGCGPVKIEEPKQWDKEPLPCFRERYCNYQNQNNPDKSYCNGWAVDCNKLLTYEYCKDSENRIKIKVKTMNGIVEGDDFFSGCWNILK